MARRPGADFWLREATNCMLNRKVAEVLEVGDNGGLAYSAELDYWMST
jgi:hypothetical protein